MVEASHDVDVIVYKVLRVAIYTGRTANRYAVLGKGGALAWTDRIFTALMIDTNVFVVIYASIMKINMDNNSAH